MNIIFLLIDGLRYDQIYGDLKESFTPNIDSLIQKGTFFKNSYASADGTVLSLNTIFNSFFPCKINNRARKIILEKNNLFNILEKENYNENRYTNRYFFKLTFITLWIFWFAN